MHAARLQTVCASMATNEQVWTGFQWWPPDVTSRGRARARAGGVMSDVQRRDGLGQGDLMYDVQRVLGAVQWGPMHRE